MVYAISEFRNLTTYTIAEKAFFQRMERKEGGAKHSSPKLEK